MNQVTIARAGVTLVVWGLSGYGIIKLLRHLPVDDPSVVLATTSIVVGLIILGLRFTFGD